MKTRNLVLGLCATFGAGLYLMNASWLAKPPPGPVQVLAHRGIYQPYSRKDLARDTCTADRIYKPTHGFLENTLPSMKAAQDAGADIVEVDVHPTTDGEFVVFHDWTVDCRTDGHGVTRDHSLAELKALDVGYGYTYDGGKTFPFRGQFKGAMPSLGEVLATFPDTKFLINIKSNDPTEAERLDAWLNAHPAAHAERLSAYGGNRPIARLTALRPAFRPFSIASIKACGFRYLALGWSGYMPKACRNTAVFVPQTLAWMAWGYPNRLQARFAAEGSYIYLTGPHDIPVQNGPKKDRIGLSGIDTPAQLAKVPKSWHMGVLTERIETIGPIVKAERTTGS